MLPFLDMGNAATIANDTEAIREWQKAQEPRKAWLFGILYKSKQGLIRQLTQKAARAEKTSEDMDDLLQAGAIGFRKACEKFDCDRGLSISTYAAHWIRHEVQRVARGATLVKLPRIRLRNAERETVIQALRKNPDVLPETLGVKSTQLEQVRNSFGLRYVSDDTPRGAVMIDRKLLSESGTFDPEDSLDKARTYRALDGILVRVRAGESADALGLSPDAYVLALEILRADDVEETMSESTTETISNSEKKSRPRHAKKPGPKPAPKASVSLREKLVEKLLAFERAKILAELAKLDEAMIARLLASYT